MAKIIERVARRKGALARYDRLLTHLEDKRAAPSRRKKPPILIDPAIVRIESMEIPGAEAFGDELDSR